MKEYHKIQSLFKRDITKPKNPIIIGDYTKPEFSYLQNNQWDFDEKIDGTNIRVQFDGEKIDFEGKTDDAQIPARLVTYLINFFFPQLDTFKAIFNTPLDTVDNVKPDICLYGEGFGGKIQKGGKYNADEGFILFDIRVGHWWLLREDVKDIAYKLGIAVVPSLGQGTLHDLVRIVQAGFPSAFGDFIAEGIVARPSVPLRARNGERIITKLKYKDFAFMR